jgi:hypothetical protein
MKPHECALSVNITRHSLGISLSFHLSLVLIGTFWLLLTSPRQGRSERPVPPELVKLIPVKLTAPPPPPPQIQPAARPAPRPQAAAPRPAVQRSSSSPARAVVRSLPTFKAPARPLEQTPRVAPRVAAPYPQARPLAPTSNRPPRTGSPRRSAASGAPPLLELEEPAATPSPAAEPTRLATSPTAPEPDSSPSAPEPGLADGHGLVVEARPVGRVDLNTPGFMALKAVDIVARFEIAADGSVSSVVLDPGTGIPEVDEEVIAYLKTIPWTPKTVGGVAVAGQQELDFSKQAR